MVKSASTSPQAATVKAATSKSVKSNVAAPAPVTPNFMSILRIVVVVILVISFVYSFGYALPRDPDARTFNTGAMMSDLFPVIGSIMLLTILAIANLFAVLPAHDCLLIIVLIASMCFFVASKITSKDESDNFVKAAIGLATGAGGFYGGISFGERRRGRQETT